MSKKSKRAKSKARYINLNKQGLPEQTKPTSVVEGSPVRNVIKTQSATITIKETQYKYINSELIRIAVIAGIFFLILLIASFIV